MCPRESVAAALGMKFTRRPRAYGRGGGAIGRLVRQVTGQIRKELGEQLEVMRIRVDEGSCSIIIKGHWQTPDADMLAVGCLLPVVACSKMV